MPAKRERADRTSLSTAKALQEQPKPYVPTEREQASIEKLARRLSEMIPSPILTFTRKEGTNRIGNSHADQITGGMLLMGALGVSSDEFLAGLSAQIVNVASKGQAVDAGEANSMLGAIKGIQPRDDVEAMLAAQMAATHNLAMVFARRLNNVDNIQQQDSAVNGLTKLTRTYAAQIGALKQYRTGGEQRVTVQHVHVNDGGQAVVGTINQAPTGGGGNGKTKDQPHALTDTRGSEMLCEVEEERCPVPRPGGER
jgi:hypothetical protein